MRVAPTMDMVFQDRTGDSRDADASAFHGPSLSVYWLVRKSTAHLVLHRGFKVAWGGATCTVSSRHSVELHFVGPDIEERYDFVTAMLAHLVPFPAASACYALAKAQSHCMCA